jgi:hypothetical protein
VAHHMCDAGFARSALVSNDANQLVHINSSCVEIAGMHSQMLQN